MRSLEDLLIRAHAELYANSSISVYTMVNGRERRRYVNPFGGVNVAMRGLVEAMGKASNSFAQFGENFRKAMPGVDQAYSLSPMFTFRQGGRQR